MKVRWLKTPKQWEAELLNLTADCKDLLTSMKRILEYQETRQLQALSKEKQPTTATPTPTATLIDYHSDVPAPEYIPPTTIPSSQSDQVDTKSGPAELPCNCVLLKFDNKKVIGWQPNRILVECQTCRVSKWYDKTPVQDVDTTISTSVKQPLKKSVESSQEEYVKLPLKEWRIEEHKSWLSDAPIQYGLTDGNYHILLPLDEKLPMAEQHAKYLNREK